MIDNIHADNNHNHEYLLKNTKLFFRNKYESKVTTTTMNKKSMNLPKGSSHQDLFADRNNNNNNNKIINK